MPRINLFNNRAAKKEIISSVYKGTFRFNSMQYYKYVAKDAAQSLIVIGTVFLAIVGAIAIAVGAFNDSDQESE